MNGWGYKPYNNFSKSVFRKDYSLFDHQFSIHVGYYNNGLLCCQYTQHNKPLLVLIIIIPTIDQNRFFHLWPCQQRKSFWAAGISIVSPSSSPEFTPPQSIFLQISAVQTKLHGPGQCNISISSESFRGFSGQAFSPPVPLIPGRYRYVRR